MVEQGYLYEDGVLKIFIFIIGEIYIGCDAGSDISIIQLAKILIKNKNTTIFINIFRRVKIDLK